MMIEFECLKLEQGTVEECDHLPKTGERMEHFKRWPGKAFEVAEVTPDLRPHPLVLLRPVE